MNESIILRCLPEDKERLAAIAQSKGLGTSELIRQTLIQADLLQGSY